MDRPAIVARLAEANGYLSAEAADGLAARCRDAAAESPNVAAEDLAQQWGVLTAPQVNRIRRQLAASTYHCAACNWTGAGRELAVIHNRVICKQCSHEEIELDQVADGAAVSPAGSRPGSPQVRPPGGGASSSSSNRLVTVATPAGQSLDNLDAGVEIDGCRVEKRIGKGGMGVVYRAVDVRLQRPVAIKILSAELIENRGQVLRFEQEARVLARLEHPNIVQIYRLGEIDGRPYLILQWVDGENLADRLRRRKDGRLPLDEAADVLVQAAWGLQAAHGQGVTHRDVKPDNILVTRDGLVKVADFGLAKPSEGGESISRAGAFMGTPGYVAPEQINSGAVGPRTDIYSLGITAYQVMTGKMPFTGEKLTDLLWHHANTPLPAPREANPMVPVVISEFIRSMAAKSPDERPESMQTVAMALQTMVPGAGMRAATRLGGGSSAQLAAIPASSLADDPPADDSLRTVASSGRAATLTPTAPPTALPPLTRPVTLEATRAAMGAPRRRRRGRGAGRLWALLILLAIGAAVAWQVPEVRNAINQAIWPGSGNANSGGPGGGNGGPDGGTGTGTGDDGDLTHFPPQTVMPTHNPDYEPFDRSRLAPQIVASIPAAGWVRHLSINADGSQLMATTSEGVTLIDARARRPLGTMHVPSEAPEALAAFLSREPEMAIVLSDGAFFRYAFEKGPPGSYAGLDKTTQPRLNGGRAVPCSNPFAVMLLSNGRAAVVHSQPDAAPQLAPVEFPGMPPAALTDVLVMPDGRTVAALFSLRGDERLAFYRTTGANLVPLQLVSVAGGQVLRPGARFVAGKRLISLPAPARVLAASVNSRHVMQRTPGQGSRHLVVGIAPPRDPDDLRDDPPAQPPTGVAVWHSPDDAHWGRVVELWRRDFEQEVTDAAITPGGELVAVALADGRVRLLDTLTGEPAVPDVRPAGSIAPSHPMRLIAGPLGKHIYVGVNRRVFAYDLYPR